MAPIVCAESPVDFNQDIRPLFSNNCLICHGPDEDERAADLRFDTEEGSRVDLGGYAAIVPGDPDASELIARITTDDEDLRMPPEGKGRQLSSEEVQLVRCWIEQGASYEAHWSYQVPERPDLPQVQVSDWPRNAIDYFVLAKLQASGLKPAPPADRLTLARRVSLDLTGLPPTWDQAQAFVSDDSENAYEKYVDALLGQPTFGERWARVWLDLARYADSAGYADDPPRTIWAYRDYVIRSLNENKPFDQFTIEQIAGDLLDDPTDDQLIATAFHRNTMTNNEGGTNNEEFRNVAVVDRVNTTMAVWMGTTMACAQCHTHKYDPITHEEYFKFFAFFNQSEDADLRDERPFLTLYSDEQESDRARLRNQIDALKDELDRSTPAIDAAQDQWLSALREEPVWDVLTPTTTSSKSREFVIRDDGWVTVTGHKVVRDTYTLTFPVKLDSLTALRLEVSDQQKKNFVLSQLQATFQPAQPETKNARFVRIELPGTGRILQIAEVQVFSDGNNIAGEAIASQSSTFPGGDADHAIDGNTDGDFAADSVAHTKAEANPWLEIDLGEAKPIDKIVVWNRTDGGPSIRRRLNQFRLSLLDSDRREVFSRDDNPPPTTSQLFDLAGTTRIEFSEAVADFSQKSFSASDVLQTKVDAAKGWAIGGALGQAHELKLTLDRPMKLGEGELTIQLNHASQFRNLLLDEFRISVTSDPAATDWVRMTDEVRGIIQSDRKTWTNAQAAKVGRYYRQIAPLLAPVRSRLEAATAKLAAIKPMTTVPVMRQVENENRRPTHVQIRGNYQSHGQAVSEGTPAIFHPLADDGNVDRLSLARWLVDPQNPLTPRVIANRHWEQIFGTGIVETSEEFGSQGELPSHPELLDWLAVELRESDWDVKHLLKLIVTSATYQQSSVTSAASVAADPRNRMLARGPRFRVSAEMVRDQALFISGLLSKKMYGPPVNPPQPELGLKAAFGAATDWKTSSGDDKYRRGLYTTWRRSSPYASMAQFDAPNREVCTVRRIRTNTPLQALVTLNDPVYVEAAQAMARVVIASSDATDDRIREAFHRALTREPSDEETQRIGQLIDDARQVFADDPQSAMQMATIPLGELPIDADVPEHAAWTVACNAILNLDELLMKR
tara:strand:- start:42662 stop:46042 length:3381 start_codon:yes stop_codon:yes gene_type:complete